MLILDCRLAVWNRRAAPLGEGPTWDLNRDKRLYPSLRVHIPPSGQVFTFTKKGPRTGGK